jgi:methylated-DNA-[protein]-cysteine S-methyltransferase
MRETQRSGSAARAATVIASPVGPLFLAATEAGLTQLRFVAQPNADQAGATAQCAAGHILREVEEQLAQYFAGRRRSFDLPLAPGGTEFQVATWHELCAIPYGETLSYRELARRLGKPQAVRAVGSANGANPVSIIVPCHRVIGSDGSLVGYGGGLDTKRRLLELEGVPLVGRGRTPRVAAGSTVLDRPGNFGSLVPEAGNSGQYSLRV